MKKNFKILYVTSARSDYDRFYWVLKDLKAHRAINVSLLVTGMHLSKIFGMTVNTIVKDGFRIAAKVPMLTRQQHAARLAIDINKAGGGIIKALDRQKPDLLLLYGDRVELLPCVTAAMMLGIPIAHCGGGQISEGAIDNQVRLMLSKASHLHYVANIQAANRLLQMGEEPWRICRNGSPSLDCIKRMPLLSRAALSDSIKGTVDECTAIVTFHPVTLDNQQLDVYMNQLIAALTSAMDKYGLNYVVTYPNSDQGGLYIIDRWKKWQAKFPKKITLVSQLGQQRYLSLMKHAAMMVGNSSSGIIEAPSFNLPVVNLGNRQKGRLDAGNVFHVDYTVSSILKGINKAIKYDRKKTVINPYGDGNSSRLMISHLKHVLATQSLSDILTKKFIDLRVKKK